MSTISLGDKVSSSTELTPHVHVPKEEELAMHALNGAPVDDLERANFFQREAASAGRASLDLDSTVIHCLRDGVQTRTARSFKALWGSSVLGNRHRRPRVALGWRPLVGGVLSVFSSK